MKTGKSLVELAQELERIQTAKRDFIVPTTKLKMNDDGDLTFKNGEDHAFKMNEWSGGQLASYTDIPKAYYDRIKREDPSLLAKNVNHGFQVQAASKDKEGRLLRTIDGRVRGLMSPKYKIMDAHDLLEATLPTLLEHEFNVVSSEITDRRLYLKTVTNKIQGEVKVGDVIQYGVMISTSDVGAGSLRVDPFLNRLSCLNGMISESTFRRAHLGSSNYDKDIQELLTDETRSLNNRAFFATVRDYIKSVMSPENFQKELDKMKRAAGLQITNFDLEKVVEVTMNEVGVRGEGIKKGILNALASGNQGAGLTMWGLANSFTFAAQSDDVDYDTATDLERAGGSVLELSPSQWKRIATVA
jgi:hypothetical protein